MRMLCLGRALVSFAMHHQMYEHMLQVSALFHCTCICFYFQLLLSVLGQQKVSYTPLIAFGVLMVFIGPYVLQFIDRFF